MSVLHRPLAVRLLLAFLPAGSANFQHTSEVEREVRAFIRTFQDATTRKDRAQLERLIAPEFTAIDRAGTVLNRAVWIELVVSGAMLAQKSDPEELSEDLAVFRSTAAARTAMYRFEDYARQRDICIKTRTV
jgi:hypothetical protein